MKGRIDRRTIRQAKRKLFEYLSPIFFEYLKKIRSMGREYLEAIAKLLHNRPLTIDDRIALSELMRVGILKPKNTRFEFVDPLFKRYMEQIISGLEPAEVTIVGHWAERIVGNYLLRKGYIPYYSHDSRGAFDIYVRIGNTDVGIQVRYTSRGEICLSKGEFETISSEAKRLGWKPIIAVVSKHIKFHPCTRPGRYSIETGHIEIEEVMQQ